MQLGWDRRIWCASAACGRRNPRWCTGYFRRNSDSNVFGWLWITLSDRTNSDEIAEQSALKSTGRVSSKPNYSINREKTPMWSILKLPHRGEDTLNIYKDGACSSWMMSRRFKFLILSIEWCCHKIFYPHCPRFQVRRQPAKQQSKEQNRYLFSFKNARINAFRIMICRMYVLYIILQ